MTRPTFRHAVAAEWVKIHSVRSTVSTIVAMAAVTVGVAVLVAATRSLPDDDTVLGGALGNAVVGQIAAGIVGVLAVCGEYSSGTIRATFAACPRRLLVLAAKTVVVATVVFVVALAAAACAHLVAAAMLAGQGYRPGAPMPALLGIALSYTAVAVLGVALGTAIRNTAAAGTAVVGILLLPDLLGPLLGGAQRWITGASPVVALRKLAQTSDAAPDLLGGLGGWSTLGLVFGYCLGAVAISGWLLRSRDA